MHNPILKDFEVVESNSSLNEATFSLKIHGNNKESVNLSVSYGQGFGIPCVFAVL